MKAIKLDQNILPSVEEVVNTLSEGGLVVAPSDTVYGLLVDATNEQAVKKLLDFKDRPEGKPISIFVQDISAIKNVAHVEKRTFEVLEHLLPGPFTIVLNSSHTVSGSLESERGTIGVRVPFYHFLHQVSKSFGKPITATSANISGKAPHYRLNSFISKLSAKKKRLIGLVVDAGTLPRNKPSTVVDLTSSDITLLRKGDVLLSDTSSFVTNSAKDTHKLGSFIIQKYQEEYKTSKKPLVFLLEGELGAGKTVFAQGMGSILGIEDIISPTYVISYEYAIKNNPYNYFVHYDLYNLVEQEEFEHIGLKGYLGKRNIIVIEWGEKSSPVYDQLRTKANIISVKLSYQSKKSRNISISEVT